MKRHTRPFLLILCAFLLLFSAAVSEGYAPWSEEDLWFYSDDMTVTQKPKGESTGGFMAYCIRLKDGEAGQTYRGLKLGDSWQDVAAKYDMSDAEWTLQDTTKQDRAEAKTQELTDAGKTAPDILADTEALCADGYAFEIRLTLYREDGQLKTESQLQYDDMTEERFEGWREYLIDQALADPAANMSREILEQYFEVEKETIFRQTYLSDKKRGQFWVVIRDGRVAEIWINDDYWYFIEHLTKEDGTANFEYAAVPQLKD